MALVVKDRVKETTATTGTGTLTLAGAMAGFQAFSAALSDGDTTYYALFESSTGEWEVGLGTFVLGSATLARTTILASSNAGSAINLTAGSAEVFITQPAGKTVVFDAAGNLTLNQDPTGNLQAATKQYVDTIAAAGLHYHDPVRVEEPTALTATYNNGTAGVGATLTNAGTQAALVLDGVTMNVADRVLIYQQADAAQNGIYTVTDVGSASTNWVLTRATDADSYSPSDPDSLGQGDAFFVLEGNTGAGELYVMNTEGTITFGTTAITFAQVASTAIYSAGDGLTLTGTTFAVGAGTGVTVNANDVSIGQDVSTSADVTFNTVTASLLGNATTATTASGVTANSVALGTDTTGNYIATGAVSGNGLSGSASSEGATFTVTSNATNANTPSTIVFRDASGNFSAGTITANLSGNATTATTATTANGVAANSVALGTDTTGNYVATIATNAGLDGTGSSEGAAVTLSLNLSELTTSTADGDGDFFVVVDTANAQRKLTKGNINISGFNNDAGYTTNVGDITGVTAGSGLTGGGTSGTVTLNHDDTSSQASVNNSNGVVIQDVTLDTYGHVTGLASVDLDTRYYTETEADGRFLRSDTATVFDDGNARLRLVGSGGVMYIQSGDTGATTPAPLYLTGYFGAPADEIRLVTNNPTVNGNTIWNAGNDGSGSGLDADTVDGLQASQFLRSDTDDSTASTISFTGDIEVGNAIRHDGDTNTYMQFHAADHWRVVTGGVERFEINDSDVTVQSALKEKYVALSGTTPSIDVDAGGAFSLTTSGNTTFTFTAFTSGISAGFILQLTAGGAHTITWPASVDWAGGTAPDAPASGETDILVFWSRDGGTTWYGIRSIDAAA